MNDITDVVTRFSRPLLLTGESAYLQMRVFVLTEAGAPMVMLVDIDFSEIGEIMLAGRLSLQFVPAPAERNLFAFLRRRAFHIIAPQYNARVIGLIK